MSRGFRKQFPKRPPLHVVLKYTLLQLPGQVMFLLILLLARQFIEYPTYLLLGLIGISVGKDVLLFPFLWRYYDPGMFPDRFTMVGRKGRALTRLNPGGFVQVRGERWQADVSPSKAPVEVGQGVCVEDIDGLRLSVRSCSEDQP